MDRQVARFDEAGRAVVWGTVWRSIIRSLTLRSDLGC
jgi:hypothetical protein